MSLYSVLNGPPLALAFKIGHYRSVIIGINLNTRMHIHLHCIWVLIKKINFVVSLSLNTELKFNTRKSI